MANLEATVSGTTNVSGMAFASLNTQDSSAAWILDEDLDAAKTGQLTTRTSATVGTLTMDTGHGITTAARLDLYWDGGQRYGILVGTVSGNSVPFTGGLGDNLPANLTAITAQVPTSINVVLVGNDIVGVYMGLRNSTANAQVSFEATGPTPITVILLESAVGSFQWAVSLGTTYAAFAGTTTAKCYVSQGDSTAGRTVYGAIQY